MIILIVVMCFGVMSVERKTMPVTSFKCSTATLRKQTIYITKRNKGKYGEAFPIFSFVFFLTKKICNNTKQKNLSLLYLPNVDVYNLVRTTQHFRCYFIFPLSFKL